ncbi:MAG: class I SAM-dependent methyltransferase [Longimicrobiales bacterium]
METRRERSAAGVGTDVGVSYGRSYALQTSDVYAELRRETFEPDIGQHSWLTAAEYDELSEWLEVGPDDFVLDVGCGAGAPGLRLAARAGCRLLGIDVQAEAIATANERAVAQGRAERARFEIRDAAQPLAYDDAAFDALISIDAIQHLPDRRRTLAEWARVLRPGGRAVFTDSLVLTGALTNEEIATRSAIGFSVFIPRGYNRDTLEEVGLRVVRAEDHTEPMIATATRLRAARAAREAALRALEGDDMYDGQQALLEIAARLGRERRLSRFAYLAVKDDEASPR